MKGGPVIGGHASLIGRTRFGLAPGVREIRYKLERHEYRRVFGYSFPRQRREILACVTTTVENDS